MPAPLSLYAFWRDPLRTLDAAAGGDATLLSSFLPRITLVSRPDLVRRVLQEAAANYCKPPSIGRIRPLFGAGLTTSDGELWRRQRSRLRPLFATPRITAWTAPILRRAVDEWLDRWQPGEEVDLAAEAAELLARITARSLFGELEAAAEATLLDALATAVEEIDRRIWAPLPLPLAVPTPSHRRLRRALAHLEAVLDERLAIARRAPHAVPELLRELVELHPPREDRQLRDEILTILAAGSTTTAAGLAWTFLRLALHPTTATRLTAELATVVGERPLEPEDPERLPWTRQVIEETLRLHPPTWITGRQAIQDDTLARVRVPAGSLVLLSPYATHRHPDHWDAPLSFRPERFELRPAPYTYLPFGGGPRLCIGRGLAVFEMAWIVASVARRFRLVPVASTSLAARAGLTLRPVRAVARLGEIEPDGPRLIKNRLGPSPHPGEGALAGRGCAVRSTPRWGSRPAPGR